MEKYYHNYKGIVIQNDDPEKMGRVKVFVPEISMTLYEAWNKDRDKDKKFTHLGSNLESDLKPDILQRLKNALPWGIVKQPIFGMGTAITYHADKDFGEPANDADNSTQHNEINKQLGSSSAENNPAPSESALAQAASAAAGGGSSSSGGGGGGGGSGGGGGGGSSGGGNNTPTNQTPASQAATNAARPQTAPNTTLQQLIAALNKRTASANSPTNTALTPRTPSSSNSASIINNYSNSDGKTPEFIQNVTIPDPVVTPPIGTTNTSGAGDNINTIVINFTPNSRNSRNLHRRFNTSASIRVEGGIATSGGASATAGPSSNIFVGANGNISTSQTPVVPPTFATFTATPPIFYEYNPSSEYLEEQKKLDLAARNAKAIEIINADALKGLSIRSTPGFVRESYISVTFNPNSRNSLGRNPGRRFRTSASLIFDDGERLTLTASAVGVLTQKTFSIAKSSISSINVLYNDLLSPINLQSERLGGLANLMSAYTKVPTGFATTSQGVVVPPMPISAKAAESNAGGGSGGGGGGGGGGESGGGESSSESSSSQSSGSYNKGGGGGELFNLVTSKLLPFDSMHKDLIKGVNTTNLAGLNHKEKIDPKIDPNKTRGSNQQKPADALPPMRSPSQNNKAKGMISIPAVGSHVSVYFDNGNPLYPIIDGVFYKAEDYKGIHDVKDEQEKVAA